jgi:predicted AlkP superfamily pyrophosphatase or phosphodiesterase
MRRFLALMILLASVAQARPRLVLFIAVDSMGSDEFLRNAPHFTKGFKRLIDGGAFFPDAHYEQLETVTAPGHSILSTGAYPWRTGVIANRFFNRDTGKRESIFSDPEHPVLGAPLSHDDVSPVRLEAETLADRLVLATAGKGHAVSVSAKARAAIAMAGHLGQPYWFNDEVGHFVTGTFYAKELPAWVEAFNAKKPADAYFDKTWTPLLPASAYSGEDDRGYEAQLFGLGRAFPHPVNGGKSQLGRDFYEALEFTPFMDDLIVDAAKAALVGEKLGHHEAPDLLCVSFSPTDHVFHTFGPYSWETQDILARLDRSLAGLIDAATVAAGGKDHLLVVLSADHGGAAVPEEWSKLGLPAGRVDVKTLADGLGQELSKHFGLNPVLGIEEENVYLDERAIAAKQLNGAEVRKAAAAWLAAQPQIAFAVPSDVIDSPPALRGFGPALQRSYFAGRSGDVVFVAKTYQVVGAYQTGAEHGMPYNFDAQVPVLMYGEGIVPGRYLREIHPTDVAPTIAALLGIGMPANSEGVPVLDALRLKPRAP